MGPLEVVHARIEDDSHSSQLTIRQVWADGVQHLLNSRRHAAQSSDVSLILLHLERVDVSEIPRAMLANLLIDSVIVYVLEHSVS